MKLQKWHLVLICAGLIFVLGFTIGWHSKSVPEQTIITIKDTVIVEQWKTNYKTCYDTIYAEETLYIDTSTHLGQIPVRHQQFMGSFPIIIKNLNEQKEQRIDYKGEFVYRGVAYNYNLHFFPQEITIATETKKKFPLHLFWALGGEKYVNSANYKYCIFTETGVRIKWTENFNTDMFLFGTYLNNEITPGVGIKMEIIK